MATKTTQRSEDFVTMSKTGLFDLPVAMAQWGWNNQEERKVLETAWKGYDAWVRWTSTSVDDLYRNPAFGQTVVLTMDRWLRWQRLSNAFAGAFFAGMWSAVGLPTAAAVQSLHEEIHALATQQRKTETTIEVLRTQERAISINPTPAQTNGSSLLNGSTQLPDLRKKATNGNGISERRKTNGIAV